MGSTSGHLMRLSLKKIDGEVKYFKYKIKFVVELQLMLKLLMFL